MSTPPDNTAECGDPDDVMDEDAAQQQVNQEATEADEGGSDGR